MVCDAALVSTDLDGNGTIEIPTMIDDGGKNFHRNGQAAALYPVADFAAADETGSHFGVYDSEYSFFLELPETITHGSKLLRTNRCGSGWMVVCKPLRVPTLCLLRTAPDRPRQRNPNPGHRRE